MVSVCVGHSSGALVRLAFLSARLGVAGQSQLEYVHAHRHGCRHCLWLQRDRDVCCRNCLPIRCASHGGAVAVYFEAAAAITTLVLLGQVLELRARSKTCSAIRALLGLAPKNARLVGADGSERDIAIDQVKVGDLLRVRPGEKDSGRWRGRRRRKCRRRIDGHRRIHSRREKSKQQSHRRHRQWHGRLADARRARRQRNLVGANCPHDQRSAAQPRADPKTRRRGGVLLRAPGDTRGAVSPLPFGRWWGRSPAWPSRSSMLSRC